MSDDFINIDITGLDKLEKGMAQFANEIERNMGAAGQAAANEILNTEGLRKYPPMTPANQAPTPYYIRGRGTQYVSKNNMKSERYGTRFYVKTTPYVTTIGNSASYAPYLGGQEQARAMGRIGWRKLADVARDKIPEITKIFQERIDYLIRKLGL